MHDYAHGEDSVGRMHERLVDALGSLYAPQVWSAVADAVRTGDSEEDRLGELSMDAAFKKFIAPEQQHLAHLQAHMQWSPEI